MPNPLLTLAAAAARILPAPARRGLYRLGPVSRWLRRSLNRAAPAGLSEVTVAAGGLRGARLLLDLQTEKDCWLGTYETNLQTAIRQMVQPGMIAYDVGANIGYVTLLLARAVGESGQVYAFEALPANVERLRKNLKLNGQETEDGGRRTGDGRRKTEDGGRGGVPGPRSSVPGPRSSVPGPVHPIHAAVVGRPSPVQFLLHRSTGMGKASGSAGRDDDYPEQITVPGLSLDHFVYEQGNPRPDVVKIDIEGGEVLALPGMARVLAEARPIIFLELHGEKAARAAWDTLTAAGYSLHRMEPGLPPIPSLDALDWKTYLVGIGGSS